MPSLKGRHERYLDQSIVILKLSLKGSSLNNFRIRNCAKASGIDDRKSINIRNMNRLTIVDPRELSRGFGLGRYLNLSPKVLSLEA